MVSGHDAPPGSTWKADVVVVGTGPGGASVAAKLAEAGRSVVMVEAGPYVPASEMTQRESEMMRKLYYEAGLRTTENGAMAVLHGRAVGGSSVVNYLDCFRTPDRLLRDWETRLGLGELTPAKMTPRFKRVETMLHVQKLDAANLNKNNGKLRDGAERLGWKGDTFHRNAYNCYGSGFCDLGCTYNAKQSAALTYVPVATHHGATLLTNARVDRVDTSGERATGVTGTLLGEDRQGRGHFSVTADLVVVSGGAIHTPYLLLGSGIEDPSGQLGRNLFTHPGSPVVGYFPEERIANYEGIKQGYYVSEFSWVLEEHPVDALLEGIGAPPAITSTIFPGFGLERLQPFEMGRAGGQAGFERAGNVFTDDGIEHYFLSSTYFESSMLWPTTKTRSRPMPPKSLKLTQTSVGKLKAMTRFSTPMKMKKITQDRLTLPQTASGKVICSPSMALIGFFLSTTAAKLMLPAKTQ